MTATATRPRKVTYQRPWLYPKQKDAFFCKERYGLCEASTKAGKTVAGLVWLTEQAMQGKAGYNYWWIAPIYPQAKIAFRRLKRALPQLIYTPNDSEQTVILGNGSIIWFKGGDKPDSLYGEDVFAAVIDEASRVKEDSWHAVRSTLTATRGPVRMIGNVKGRKNWFYRLCRTAEAGEQDMHYARIIAADAVAAGVLDAAEIEDARRQLPDAVFRQLYLAEPSDDEGNPFGMAAIRECIAPITTAPVFVWGVDLAKSVDWTVQHGLDKDGRTAAWARYQLPWQETTARLAASIGGTRALVDSTGVGDPITEALQRKCPRIEGYKFTAQSKQQLMEGLALAIQKREVRFPDGPIVNELETFEYQYTKTGVRYAGVEGMHDDCVCALALAVSGRANQPRSTFIAI